MGFLDWLRALGGGPGNPMENGIVRNYVNSGWAHADNGDTLRAEMDFETAVGMQPENYKLRVAYGEAMLKLNKLNQANKQLAAAIKLQPQLPRAWFVMAQVFSIKALEWDNADDAEKTFREAFAILEKVAELNSEAPQSDIVPREHVKAAVGHLMERKQRLDARWKPDLVSQRNSPVAEAAYTEFYGGRPESARRLFEQALQSVPNDPDILRVYAHVLFLLDCRDEAVLHMRKAIQNAPTALYEPQVWCDVIAFFLELGQVDEAKRYLAEAEERGLAHPCFVELRREIRQRSSDDDTLGSDSPYDRLR
jgi:tetratricopeptide (TPR) repeat protein